ncbi:hypothetical protein MIMGU_mgv1a017470mg [Erythranthe guttata]|uniref:Uncharacterized protein n=1 Tax=Erythranthe guttata TaxID=4155 RepID=A0A022QQ20_ERYGU|nr:hypothetical protein MIMGU_mgv1a017470mg [Erythranthe guttata]
MKTWVVLFVASLLIVGSIGRTDPKFANTEKRMLRNNEVNRNVPGGPNICYHCFGDSKVPARVPPSATNEVHS